MVAKRNSRTAAKADVVEAAFKDYRAKRFKSLNAAAKAHGVPESTLRARKNGHVSRRETHESK